MTWFKLTGRRALVLGLHLALVVLSNYLAFWLRFDGAIPSSYAGVWLSMLPVLVVVRMATLWFFRAYSGIWRYASLWDLRNLVLAAGTSTVVFYAITRLGFGLAAYPRAVYIIDTTLLILFLGGLRFAARLWAVSLPQPTLKPLLIYGAGDAGETIVRDLLQSAQHGYRPIAFIDDDPHKKGHRIHGVPVLGGRSELADALDKTNPHTVLIAMPSVRASVIREIVTILEPYKIGIVTLPHLGHLLDGRVAINQIRNLSIEDLLDRAPVGLDTAPVHRLVTGKCVMVTGAGGSIGSELCRQIASFGPSRLLLFERHENSLYAIHTEMEDAGHGNLLLPLIGDVTDRGRVDQVLRMHLPQIIFHAAAHKHVPMMEYSPCEAAKNNVGGTRVLAEAADRYGVERFIMISTDKAVNPTSIMGVTKRVGELIIQDLALRSETTFVAVRFGNVLGSNGSVVPRFLKQIKAGGPVTITHPDIRRYFMLIPEAVQLVLHAAAHADAGAVYVLDMGEQIRVLDLARQLIRLAGFIPEEDIPITFVGLRPGEKLYEELVGGNETVEASSLSKILRVRPDQPVDADKWTAWLTALEQASAQGDTRKTMWALQQMVPSFNPESSAPQMTV